MADRNILTIVNGQISLQPATDNLVLRGPLDTQGYAIVNTGGDLVIATTNQNNIISGNGHSTNNAALSIIAGGKSSTINSGNYCFIGSGNQNAIVGDYNTILGGDRNTINAAHSTILGGYSNNVTGNYSVASGNDNTASGNCSSVAGDSCTANGDHASVHGGKSNIASGIYSTVLGGNTVLASGNYSVAAGNTCNATGHYSAVLGGQGGVASGDYSFVGGGVNNTSSGNYSAVCGGSTNNNAGHYSAIIGGQENTISSGADWACIPGGRNNIASGDYALALGNYASADQLGCIAQAGGRFSITGDAQMMRFITYVQTASNTASRLYLDGSSLELVQPENSVWMCKVFVAGLKTDGTLGCSYYFLYTTRRDGAAAPVAVTAGAITNYYAVVMTEDNAGFNAAMGIGAGNVIYASAVGVSGAGTTYNWVATWEVVQVIANA